MIASLSSAIMRSRENLSPLAIKKEFQFISIHIAIYPSPIIILEKSIGASSEGQIYHLNLWNNHKMLRLGNSLKISWINRKSNCSMKEGCGRSDRNKIWIVSIYI